MIAHGSGLVPLAIGFGLALIFLMWGLVFWALKRFRVLRLCLFGLSALIVIIMVVFFERFARM